MSKLRIGYFADGPWSHNAFDLLCEDEEVEIAFIVPRVNTSDDNLKRLAKENDIDYIHPIRVNSDQFRNKARQYACDLFVSMSFNQIFRPGTFTIPRLNTINCHAGLLPFYRGRNVLNWALINDESEFGITVHFIDEGIDTGDIIVQETFPIIDSDDYQSLLHTAYSGCADVLYKAIKMIQRDEYQRVEQHNIHPVGSYCGRRQMGDEIIDWNTNSRDIFNFIRALANPGPRATTFIGKDPIRINSARYIEKAPDYINIPGQILKCTDAGFLVKTADSFIEIQELDTDIKLKVGDRFEDGEL